MILAAADRRVANPVPLSFLHGAEWDTARRLGERIGGHTWPVNVVMVDDAEMAALNRQYRRISAVTDVLSFSYLLDAGEGEPDLRRGQAYAAADLWREKLPDGSEAGDVVGELIVAPNFVATRCAERNWPLGEELPWLVVHGCLHLVGWDHERPAEREAMLDVEQALLAGESLRHPLRQRS